MSTLSACHCFSNNNFRRHSNNECTLFSEKIPLRVYLPINSPVDGNCWTTENLLTSRKIMYKSAEHGNGRTEFNILRCKRRILNPVRAYSFDVENQ